MKRYSFLFIFLMLITFKVKALVITNEEMIKNIDDIFASRVSDSYTIEYSNDIDINYINKYIRNNYSLKETSTNIYTYEDFINYNRLRFTPTVNNNKYTFEVQFNILKDDEYNEVMEFGRLLKAKYSNLSDSEKVYLVINYIKNNITKSNSTSLYDAIYNNNINESYVLTQFMLSNLNIESYITDRLDSSKKSTRRYNLVKLNDKWYILDIDNDFILVGYETSDFKPDTYSNNIIVSKYNYKLGTYNLDINEIKTLINKEDKEVIEVTSVNTTTTTKINEETTELNNKDYTELIEWIFLITSLGIIMLVVYYNTQ